MFLGFTSTLLGIASPRDPVPVYNTPRLDEARPYYKIENMSLPPAPDLTRSDSRVRRDVFVLHRAPQSFNKNLVKDAASPIHTNSHPSCFELG